MHYSQAITLQDLRAIAQKKLPRSVFGFIDGAANEYLIKFLSKELKVKKSDIVIEKGLTSQFKKIELNVSDEYFNSLHAQFKK